MSGREAICRAELGATLTGEIKIKPGRTNFLRGLLTLDNGNATVVPLEGQGSGVISTMVAANCYIIVGKDSTGYQKGAVVKVQPFDPSVFLKARQ